MQLVIAAFPSLSLRSRCSLVMLKCSCSHGVIRRERFTQAAIVPYLARPSLASVAATWSGLTKPDSVAHGDYPIWVVSNPCEYLYCELLSLHSSQPAKNSRFNGHVGWTSSAQYSQTAMVRFSLHQSECLNDVGCRIFFRTTVTRRYLPSQS